MAAAIGHVEICRQLVDLNADLNSATQAIDPDIDLYSATQVIDPDLDLDSVTQARLHGLGNTNCACLAGWE